MPRSAAAVLTKSLASTDTPFILHGNFPVLNAIYENYIDVVDGKADAVVSAMQRFTDYEIFY